MKRNFGISKYKKISGISILFLFVLSLTSIYLWPRLVNSESNIISVEDELEFQSAEQSDLNSQEEMDVVLNNIKEIINDWERPDLPLTIGIQIGHWKNEELPDELENLRGYSTGTSYQDYTEIELCLNVAEQIKEQLESYEIEVNLLPATIPESYWADLFISLHMDGNDDTSVSGFKVASSWVDLTGLSDDFKDIIYQEYAKSTGLNTASYIPDSMQGYYAFNWWKYDHAVHPMTLAVVIELGFLSNFKDRQLIVNNPELAAEGITNSIIAFLNK